MRKLGAILSRELFATLRSGWAMIALGSILTIVGAAFCIAWVGQAGTMMSMNGSLLSRRIFYNLSASLFGLMALISPVMNASAVSRERESRTLDLLLCTGIPRLSILFAKWIAAVGFQIMLVLLLMPLLALSFQLGGIGLDEYMIAGLMILQAIMVYGMVGLAISCHFRRSATATMTAIGIMLLLIIGWPVAFLFCNGFLGTYRYISPDLSGGIYAVSPISAAYTIGGVTSAGRTYSLFQVLYLLRSHLGFQLALFLSAVWAAWRGLNRKQTPRSATAKAIIDDPELLRQRSRSFPYYLIDPLKRVQEIGDHQNPVYERERRYGAMSKISTLIRISYFGAFISIFVGLALFTSNAPDSIRMQLNVNLCFILIFVPILSAASISKEREEGTLDMLQITLVKPWKIVTAKFMAAWRFLLFLLLGVSVLPAFLYLGLSLFASNGRVLPYLGFVGAGFAEVIPLAFAYTAFYAAVGVYISARSKRTILSILLTYFTLFGIIVLPYVLDIADDVVNILDDISKSGYAPAWAYEVADFFNSNVVLLLDLAASPLSAPYWLTDEGYRDSAYLNRYGYGQQPWHQRDEFLTTIVALAVTSIVTLLLLWRATKRLQKTAAQ